jgi:2-(1,2-epoxy-1,2-dihydrophenyl)acetyl-CoA isomerase
VIIDNKGADMNAMNYEVLDGVATIAIQRPAVRNALDAQLISDINVALDKIQRANSGVRAVVLTGSDSVFCSGVDLRSMDLSTPEARQRAHLEMRAALDPLVLRLSEFRFPILAAVNGAAVGTGMSLALASDIIVMADTAFFSPSFLKLGFVPDAGVIYTLARRIGGGRSLAALLLAQRIDAVTAVDWGLAYEVVPEAEVLARTVDLARALAAGPTRAIGKLRSLHAAASNISLREHLVAERRAQEDTLTSGECVKGVRAFFEKRRPSFREDPT